MNRIHCALAAGVLVLVGAAASAQEALPAGPVVVTVAGKISRPNRGPVDPFMDGFFAYAEVTFEEARAFDVAALEALGTRRITTRYPKWPRAYAFEGPLLGDVLAAAGAEGTVVKVTALDGYAAEIPMAEVSKYPIVLALKRDGRYLGIGDRGPAWIVWPRDDYPELQARDETAWVWSAYLIVVE
jgi:hypothetical protein